MAANRGVVVGASTLVGRELIEELGSSQAWDLRLADVAGSTGQFVAGGDQALIIQPLSPDIFEGREVAFFTADSKITRAHWKEAKAAGAVVIDLSGSLEPEPDAVVRCPWIGDAAAPASATIIVPAHPAAVILGLIASRLRSVFADMHIAATVLEPASQQGSPGLDEMHQQTVSLLGLHSVPQDVYDAQVAFNLRIALGDEAKLNLKEIAATIRRHLKAISDEPTASSVTLQLVQAPVFHGYTMSIYVQLPADADAAAIRRALHGGLIAVTNSTQDAPSNQSVMQESGISIALTEDSASPPDARAYWLWVATDNLKLSAREAMACAEEVIDSRGGSKGG